MSNGSSAPIAPESTGGVRGWNRPGLSPRGERMLDFVGGAVLVALTAGWVWSIVHARPAAAAPVVHGGLSAAAASVTSALTNVNAPTAAYVTDAALNAIADRVLARARGASGKLRVAIESNPSALRSDTLPPGVRLEYSRGGQVSAAPTGAGLWSVLLAIGNAVRPVSSFNVIAMLPFSAKQNGHIGAYYVGTWPSEHGAVGPAKAPPGAYGNPAGFIEVTPDNRDTQVSEHFKLGDFVTHDQPNVWPKYIVLQQRLLDKLELVLADLQAHGTDIRGVKVMSGFRTPQYNYTGGNTAGRAANSRHMFGDASDIYIDNIGSGQMNDLNHDGRVDINDAGVILEAVERVEAAHPELVGGGGVYTAAPGHGPFIHIDTRGYRARWVGTSGG